MRRFVKGSEAPRDPRPSAWGPDAADARSPGPGAARAGRQCPCESWPGSGLPLPWPSAQSARPPVRVGPSRMQRRARGRRRTRPSRSRQMLGVARAVCAGQPHSRALSSAIRACMRCPLPPAGDVAHLGPEARAGPVGQADVGAAVAMEAESRERDPRYGAGHRTRPGASASPAARVPRPEALAAGSPIDPASRRARLPLACRCRDRAPAGSPPTHPLPACHKGRARKGRAHRPMPGARAGSSAAARAGCARGTPARSPG